MGGVPNDISTGAPAGRRAENQNSAWRDRNATTRRAETYVINSDSTSVSGTVRIPARQITTT